ncbi:PIN domain-containing protein [Pelagicoccus sp. SDUM812005]|uniref:PIN domain-containing protein n=1 Tax=Pelagicoccus sp. SDUM812005 TaxID=3041257 RepID=UPI00280DC7C3|nr:PIN domain-containing protein [Pelagicoccus sp. SDUM812005]MDQ8181688.1 PIN domain-containing protein [Pelagicoccus sp. SDUM812005]
MKKRTKAPIQSYAFIDTNIFLDFYRTSNEANLTLLEKLNSVRHRIISTYQVEMEFLKNRQTTLLGTINGISSTTTGSIPAVAIDSNNKEALEKIRKNSKTKISQINKKISSILSDPNGKDRVYRVLEGIFSNEAEHVLTRDMPIKEEIKELAYKRFLLGYPPRKAKDTSYGDAINWEWIIETSKKLKGRIYIVSRDGDYGCEHNSSYFLNDQLKKEFRERVGNKSIVFTKKLTEALKALEVKVTREESEAEVRSLKKSSSHLESKSHSDSESDYRANPIFDQIINSILADIKKEKEDDIDKIIDDILNSGKNA